jgi:outer membrane protein TolC
MFATKEKLEQLEEAGQLNLKIQIENTLSNVTSAYYQIVMEEQLIAGIEKAKAVSEERIKLAEKKLQLGNGSNVELLQAKLDLNAQRSLLLAENNNLVAYKSSLLALLKMDPFGSIQTDTNFVFQPIKSVEEIKQGVEKTNHSLMLAQKNVSISNQVIKEIRSQRMPKVGLNANYVFGRNQSAAGFALLNQNLGYTAGITFSWNLFNGFNTNHQIKIAELQYQNSEVIADQLKYNLFSQVSAAYYQWLGATDALKLEEENILLAEESLKITAERMRLGLGNYLEIKESQKSYEDALTRLVTARYNLKLAETGLKKLTGELVK